MDSILDTCISIVRIVRLQICWHQNLNKNTITSKRSGLLDKTYYTSYQSTDKLLAIISVDMVLLWQNFTYWKILYLQYLTCRKNSKYYMLFWYYLTLSSTSVTEAKKKLSNGRCVLNRRVTLQFRYDMGYLIFIYQLQKQ